MEIFKLEEELKQALQMINSTRLNLEDVTDTILGQNQAFPLCSCGALPPSSPSGYYWVRASNYCAVRVYCDSMPCDGVTGGWMRVAVLDMTNSSHQCPSGLKERNDSNIRTCVNPNSSAGCSPDIVLSTLSITYAGVCGRITGYQIGTTNGFHGEAKSNLTHYVDGVSLTHGNKTKHIWSFAAANNPSAFSDCPCLMNHQTREPSLSFVGINYFCDTGSTSSSPASDGAFLPDNPLWIGAGCTGNNKCCRFNTPPWFHRQLPQPTTDDIEMRVCRDEMSTFEDIAIELIEIYVQ